MDTIAFYIQPAESGKEPDMVHLIDDFQNCLPIRPGNQTGNGWQFGFTENEIGEIHVGMFTLQLEKPVYIHAKSMGKAILIVYVLEGLLVLTFSDLERFTLPKRMMQVFVSVPEIITIQPKLAIGQRFLYFYIDQIGLSSWLERKEFSSFSILFQGYQDQAIPRCKEVVLPIHFSLYQELLHRAKAMEAFDKDDGQHLIGINWILIQSLVLFIQLKGEVKQSNNPYVEPERIMAIVEQILEKLDQPINISGISRSSGLNPNRLRHLFIEHFGLSFRQFLEKLRLEKSKELLLESNLPIREIAAMVGFSNPAHFSSLFKAKVGSSPTAFRMGNRPAMGCFS